VIGRARRVRRGAIVGALCVAVLAACGSSAGSKGAGSTTTSTTGPDGALAADRRLADAAIIRPEDLPGFTATPRTGAGEAELQDLADGVPGCEFLVAGRRDGRVRVRSPRFSQDQVRIAEDVSVYATPAALAAQIELYRNPGIIGCLQAVYQKVLPTRLPAGSTVQDVSVSPIAVENAGDAQFGFRLSVTFTEDGRPQTGLSDIVGVSVGRVGVSLNVDAPLTADLAQVETTLVPLLVHRVENAQR
jgi:hypothetical protein